MTAARTQNRRSFERTLASAKRTMLLSEIVSLAIDSFRANKVRVMLTSLGMVIGSASLIMVVTVGLTGKQYILHLIEAIGSNMVEVEYSGGGPGSNTQHDFRNDYLTLDDETAVLEQVPSVAYSSPMLQMHDRISFGNGVSKDILVLGVSPQYQPVRNLILLNGRFFDEEDDASHAKVAVITEPFARQKFGTLTAVNQTFEIKGIPFTVIGTFKEAVDTLGQTEVADQTILIPYSVARYFTGTDAIKRIFFSIRDTGDVELATKQIVAVIRARHRPSSVYESHTLTELLNTAALIANVLTLVLLLVSSVTLAVGGIGIMNIMLANVRSRIREIGIRKALGATYREIKLQFLIEAVFISLSGGVFGTILGLAVPYSVRLFTSYRIPISGLSAIIALAAATLVGVVLVRCRLRARPNWIRWKHSSMSRAAARWRILATILLLICCCSGLLRAASLPLVTGWKLQSGCLAQAPGERISSAKYAPAGWIDALVPGTVLGSQVADGVFPDPFFGMNLRKIPGTDYPIGKIFGYFPMNARSPYRCSWWYRTSFAAPAAGGKTTWLHFDGINYRANIWMNGKQIAGSDQVAGAFRSYDFDVSRYLKEGSSNVLAVEVFAQTEKDLGIDFLDWNAAPADKSLGLWRPVSLNTTGTVTVRNPAVSTHFPQDDLAEADLRIVADVSNHSSHAATVTVTAATGAVVLRQQVTLAANENRVVVFAPEEFSALRVKHPAVWWPYQYGTPHLERLRIAVIADGVVSDARNIRFGIREAQASLNEKGFLQFRINHRDILIRGGGWDPDMFYREPAERLRQEFAYVRHMNLNTVRLEGKLGSEEMFDLADEMGILIMPGWQCCDFWQHWDKWTAADHSIAHDSLYSQISRLRAHPSVFVWLNGSDEIPVAPVERDFLDVLKERDWADPILSSAADRSSDITGPSGVKMTGPYDYVPPEYWYLDKDKLGGGFGFNTETGPGAAIPGIESIHRTLPSTGWWPVNDEWNYHAALGKFANYSRLNRAMDATYGPSANLETYTRKAQLMAYDGERTMFEAYGANKYTSTGVIQWMLNNAWPSFFWHLYDYYLVPGGGYFGTRKANEPLHIQYRYDDRRIVVVNSTLTSYQGLHATARVVDLGGKEAFAQESGVDVAADGVATAFVVPAQSGTSFLKLMLRDARGDVVSDNFYWVPAKLAVLDWKKSTYVNTPAVSYADMRDLEKLPRVLVAVRARPGKEHGTVMVTLRNEGKVVAFFVHLRAVRPGKDEEIAPVFWEDNFVSLLPGESRVLGVSGLPGEVEIKLDGWNAEARSAAVEQ